MQKSLKKLLKDVEFEANAEFDMHMAEHTNVSLKTLKGFTVTNEMLKTIQNLLRESFTYGSQYGCLTAIRNETNT